MKMTYEEIKNLKTKVNKLAIEVCDLTDKHDQNFYLYAIRQALSSIDWILSEMMVHAITNERRFDDQMDRFMKGDLS